ncbi:MAG: hypothetical protein ACOCUS_04330 [Polyangiales bacterium]
MEPLGRRCRREVEDLHAFFVEWFNGAVPQSEETFARATSALAGDFELVSPRGARDDRESILREIRGAYGGREGQGFSVAIEDFRVKLVQSPLCVVTYVERHRSDEQSAARLSTAIFREREDAPEGVEWVHLHETWLPNGTPG